MSEPPDPGPLAEPSPREPPAHPGCCPYYHQAVELIGRRWSGAIVAVLLHDGPQRFSAIRERVPGVSDRLLSQRMRELEAAGIVTRTVETGPPVRVSYELTAKGCDLRDVVAALRRWGQRWAASAADASADAPADVASAVPPDAAPATDGVAMETDAVSRATSAR